MQIIVGALKALLSLVTASPEHLGESQMATVCNITVRFRVSEACPACLTSLAGADSGQ
jgi:hypothetical protein